MELKELKKLAWLGDDYIQGDIKGVVMVFHGLGYGGMKDRPDAEEYECAKAGYLVVFPYYGPWCWMNREARKFTDDILDEVFKLFKLKEDTSVISTGGSMGGLSALLFARYSKRPVTKCLALYPVCDLKYHFTERDDVERTVLSAFRGYNEDLDKLLTEHSPIEQVGGMPDIPYLFIHGYEDGAVNKAHHSDRMVKKMIAAGLNVKYMEEHGLNHGGMNAEMMNAIIDFIIK